MGRVEVEKITKTFYVRSDDLEKLQRKKNSEVFLYSSELDQPVPGNPIEITFSVPEKIAQVSESEFKNLWFGSRYEQAAKKLFGESHD